MRSDSVGHLGKAQPRVLFLTPYAFRGSGVWTFVTNLRKELETQSVETSLPDFTARTVPSVLKSALVCVNTFTSVWRRRRSIDIIHCQQLYLQSFVACFLGRVLGKATLITVHGLPPRSPGLRGAFLRLVELLSVKICNTMVCVADSLRKQLGTGTVISNGVRVASIRSAMLPRDEVRRSLGIGDEFVAVFAGRITQDKGCLVLFEAAERILISGEVRLRLLLFGPVEEKIRALVSSRLRQSQGRYTYMGELDEPWRFYGAADVFLLPSFREGMPMSVLEAMAAGLPIIATPVGDIPEAISEGKTGWLVPVGDGIALGKAIVAASLAARREEIGKEAARVATARFDLSATTRAYLSLYSDLIKSLRG